MQPLLTRMNQTDFDANRHQQLIDQANAAVADTHVDPRWHPQVHVAPKAAWMNDPNGVCYFKGRYHMFFQHHPYGTHWGPMHWGHATSSDLVNWKRESIALAPSEKYDEGGVWSGSAVVTPEGDLVVLYTGNRFNNGHDDVEGKVQSQCLAISKDGLNFLKLGVVIEAPEGVEDIRDPKVWLQDERWWMVLGVSAPVEGQENKRGQVWLYSSKDLVEWDFDRVLFEDPDPLCYMIECPDFFCVDGKWVLVYCPMTHAPRRGYGQRNGHNAGYAAGKWRPGEEFAVEREFSKFDWGHHYYAPQSMEAPDGRRLMFGWMGGFELPLACQARDGWSGQLATPRVASVDDQYVLRAQPIRELSQLREDACTALSDVTVGTDETIELLDDTGPCDIELEVDLVQSTSEQVSLLVNRLSATEYTEVAYDSLSNRVILDRGKVGPTDRGYRSAPYTGGDTLKLRVIVDHGSVEVFIGDCAHALSSLLFPRDGKRSIALASTSGTIAVRDLRVYPLNTIWT